MRLFRSSIFFVASFAALSGGCVTAESLRQVVTSIGAGQADIITGTDALQALCQSRGGSEGELQACRDARGKVRTGIAKQVEAIKSWTK